MEIFHHNGQLKTTYNYKDGRLDGPLEVFYETGQLESKRFYKNGELDGLLETYYDNGQLKSKGNYQEGKKVGTSERYHSNGQLKTKNNYKGGKLDGVHEIYHENGSLRHKGNFKEGNLINWLQPKTGGYEWNSGLTVFLKNRYIRLDNELLQPNSICHGGVDLNSALKRRNYGSIWNTGISIWTNSVHSNTKTNKDLKRKRNSRRESQRRVMHQTNPLNHGWIVSIVEVNHE